MTDRLLHVLLYGTRIGHVVQTHQGRHSFVYDPDYARAPDATPLSLSMPVASTEYPKSRIEPFLLGLLPDSEDVRTRWGARFTANPNNPFALLEHMGLDCAGAVQFATTMDEALTRPGLLDFVSDEDIAARLVGLRADESAWSVPGERWSLAGAQAKFALARDGDGRWCEPVGAAPSTHIIKPGVTGYRLQALNEHVCLTAARLLGLPAARTEYTEFAGEPALVVTRYDRRRNAAGSAVRVHQEDMCQALSVYPHRKYEANGGPTAAKVADLLWQVATDPSSDVQRFSDAVAFNYLVGAPDAHAKNYSVLLAGSQVRLAPLYDVASALPYDPPRSDHELDRAAMSIGGRNAFGSVEARHWDRFASQCRVPADSLRESVTRLASGLPGALEAAFEPFGSSDLRERLLTRVADLARTTLRSLTAAS